MILKLPNFLITSGNLNYANIVKGIIKPSKHLIIPQYIYLVALNSIA